MEDCRENFKRDLDRLTYMYAKANTISKKKQIASDLLFFEFMYNNLSEEKVEFPWSNDRDLIIMEVEKFDSFFQNVIESFNSIYNIADNSFNIFLEEEFSVHKYYGKYYHKMDEQLMQKYIGMFFREMDSSLVERFKYKLENLELIVNPNVKDSAGTTFPIESINKNIIFFEAYDDMSVDSARILAHEMGHDFEFENAKKAGVTNTWLQLFKSLFTEVSSCFFEYAFINYLIENRIYLEDARISRSIYFYQLFFYLSHIMIIDKISDLRLQCDFTFKLDDDCVIEYANDLLGKMNVSCELYEKGDSINFRDAFVYGLGRLLSVYIYEEYKNNSKEFLSNFRKMLLDYKDNGFESFKYLNIDEEKLLNGDVLRRTLKLYKQDM